MPQSAVVRKVRADVDRNLAGRRRQPACARGNEFPRATGKNIGIATVAAKMKRDSCFAAIMVFRLDG